VVTHHGVDTVQASANEARIADVSADEFECRVTPDAEQRLSAVAQAIEDPHGESIVQELRYEYRSKIARAAGH